MSSLLDRLRRYADNRGMMAISGAFNRKQKTSCLACSKQNWY